MRPATVHIHSRRVDFEKWQALGNDYVIVERASSFELTPPRIRASCAPATPACSPTGSCCCRSLTSPASSPGCGSSTPTARRPSCRATARARRSCTCARAGWTESRHVLDSDRGRRDPPDDHVARPAARLGHGRARLRSADYPAGARDGRGELTAGGRTWRFQHVQVGNPAVRDPGRRRDALDGTRPAGDRAGRSSARAVPEPHQRLVVHAARAGPDPGADLRARRGGDSASGTGAIGRGGRASCSTAAIHRSPWSSTAASSRSRSQTTCTSTLSGWAVPVFRGTLADEFVKELHATE